MAGEKVYSSPEAAVADVASGAVVLIGGFAGQGIPTGLLRALSRRSIKDLTCVFSPGGAPDSAPQDALAEMVGNGQVRKIVSALPFPPGKGGIIEEHWQEGRLELEIVPQGTLAERLRAGGAGLGGVFLPSKVDSRFAGGKEYRKFGDQQYMLEGPLRADFALLRAHTADSLGNTVYRGTGRHWGPTMAMAGGVSIVEVDRICEPGELDPEVVITPGIFVNRIVQTVGE